MTGLGNTVVVMARAEDQAGTQPAGHRGTGWLMVGLRRCGAWTPSVGWGAYLLKVFVACTALAAVLLAANAHIDWLALKSHPWTRVGWLGATMAAAGGVYLALLWLMGLRLASFRRSN